MRASPIKTSFNAGELSPLLDGRVDIDKYASGCSLMRNCVPLMQGPATRRPGTRFVSEVFDSTKRTWLARFEFNYKQAFILEFSPGKLRFYTNQGLVLSGGVPYVIDTPFTAAMLTTSEGIFGLQMVQSNDVIYIVCRDLPPQKLQRLGNTNWTISEAPISNGPFQEINNTESLVVHSSAKTGAVTISGPSPSFWTGRDNQLFYLQQSTIDTIKAWEGNKAFTVAGTTADYRRNGNNNYQGMTAGTTGYVAPVHTVGERSDGDPGVTWKYLDSGYAVVKLGTATPGNSAIPAIVQGKYQVPEGAVSSDTYRWAYAEWSPTLGYPQFVTYYKDRLVFARDQKVWFSKSADYENFAAQDFGTITDASAFTIEVQAAEGAAITYLMPTTRGLIVGTSSGEHLITQASNNEAFSQQNYTVSQASGIGGIAIKPIRVDESVLFVQRAGRKVRETAYSFETDGFTSADVNILADHITAPNIIDSAIQREPWSIIWYVTSDGALVGLTYNKEQQVRAWHKHVIADGLFKVESIASISNPNGLQDDLWFVGTITIAGIQSRYVCYMEQAYKTGDNENSCFYVDLGRTYSGAPTTTISGLNYLNGREVEILTNGSYTPPQTVIGGSITLPRAASVVQIGLKYTPIIRTMRIEAGAGDGTAQGKIKRINSVVLRLINSLAVKCNAQNAKLKEFIYRKPSDKMDQPVPLVTGDITISTGSYDKDGYITITQDQPYPMTVVAIMPQVVTSDKGDRS